MRCEEGRFHAWRRCGCGVALCQVLWQAKRDAKLLRERQQRSASELEGCTFAPAVNKTRPSTAAAPVSVTAEEAIKAARAAAKAGQAEHAVKATVEGEGDVGQRLYEQAQEKARRLEAKQRARQEERDREESALVAAAVRPASPYKRPQSASAAVRRSSSGGGGVGTGTRGGDGYLVRRRGVPYRGQGMDQCTFRPHINVTPKFKTTPSRWKKALREATPEAVRAFKDEAPFEASELLLLDAPANHTAAADASARHPRDDAARKRVAMAARLAEHPDDPLDFRCVASATTTTDHPHGGDADASPPHPRAVPPVAPSQRPSSSSAPMPATLAAVALHEQTAGAAGGGGEGGGRSSSHSSSQRQRRSSSSSSVGGQSQTRMTESVTAASLAYLTHEDLAAMWPERACSVKRSSSHKSDTFLERQQEHLKV